jgi:hypothetical protein
MPIAPMSATLAVAITTASVLRRECRFALTP